MMPRQNFYRFPVTTLLETEGNIRVVRELSLLPESVNADFLAKVTSMQPRGVRIILNRYIKLGIVDAEGKGPARLYLLSSHPLSQALRTLFLAEERLYSQELKIMNEALEDRPEAISGWIHGSDLRDDEAGTNSLDMIVIAATETPSALRTDIHSKIASGSARLADRLSIIVLTPPDIDLLAENRLFWFMRSQVNAIVIKGSLPLLHADNIVGKVNKATSERQRASKRFTRFRRT